MTFNDCLIECCQTPDLVREFDRLNGSNLFRVLVKDTRAPITRMIDESTGYQKELDRLAHEQMQTFISFVFECVWLPFLNTIFKELKK